VKFTAFLVLKKSECLDAYDSKLINKACPDFRDCRENKDSRKDAKNAKEKWRI